MFAHVANCINFIFRGFVESRCGGCEIDHTSQTQHMYIIEAKEVLLDMFLNDMLEELCENRLEEYIDNWVYEVEQNQELSLYYRHSDMAILDLSICLCFELQQPKKLEVLKQFILHY